MGRIASERAEVIDEVCLVCVTQIECQLRAIEVFAGVEAINSSCRR